MGRRYSNTDATGATVWLQDGLEVHRATAGGWRVCFDPAHHHSRAAWVPGTFPTVDEAFAAGRIARSVARMQARHAAARAARQQD